MTNTIHSCGPTCTNPACITARVPLLTSAQCMEFRRMNCSFEDMVRAIYAAGIQAGAREGKSLPRTGLLFSRRMAIAKKLGIPADTVFTAIVRLVEEAHNIPEHPMEINTDQPEESNVQG